MSTDNAGASGPRLYGNWRAERGWGVGSLSTTSTVVLFAAVLIPLIGISVSPAATPALLAGSVTLIAATVVRVGGVCATDIVVRRWRFHRARAAGWTELSAGVLVDHPRAADLPGVLAPLRPLDLDDGRGGRHALLWHRRTGTLTAVLRCSPIGLDLADEKQTDAWVASWGALLADLGYLPMLCHLAVTIDTAPAGGTTVREHITAALDPTAPALSRRILDELVELTPATTADIDTRVAICLDPARATPRPPDLLAAAVEVGRRLPAIENHLAACGVAILGRATPGWLVGRIRAAFDPHARPDIARLTEPDPHPTGHRTASWPGRTPDRSPRSSTGTATATRARCRSPGRCAKPPDRRSGPVCSPRCSRPAPTRGAPPGSTTPTPPSRRRRRSRPRSPPGRSAARGRSGPDVTKPNANATTAPAPCNPPARKPRAPAWAGSPST